MDKKSYKREFFDKVSVMRVVRSAPQENYPHGTNMCTSAAWRMCITMLYEHECMDNLGDILRRVMLTASEEHGRFGDRMVGVHDILADMLPPSIHCDFYSICAEGCTELDEHGKPTSFMINQRLLIPCLTSDEIKTALLTSGDHSVAVWKYQDKFGFFDSTPSSLTVCMTLDEFDQALSRFIVGQCDVVIISKIQQGDYH
jgi:hypothetical protein